MSACINLLPSRVRRFQALKTAIRVWLLVWLSLVAVTIAMIAMELSRLNRISAQRQKLEAVGAECTEMEQDIARMQRRLTALQQREQSALALAADRPVLTLLGTVSRAARACDDKLYLKHLSLRRATLTSVAAGKAAPAKTPSTAVLDGIAASNLHISRFAACLREAGVFSRVDVKSSVEKSQKDLSVLEFRIECAF
jgi:hypothetical protein